MSLEVFWTASRQWLAVKDSDTVTAHAPRLWLFCWPCYDLGRKIGDKSSVRIKQGEFLFYSAARYHMPRREIQDHFADVKVETFLSLNCPLYYTEGTRNMTVSKCAKHNAGRERYMVESWIATLVNIISMWVV